MGFWGTMGTRGWALRGPGGQGTWGHVRGCWWTMETVYLLIWACGAMCHCPEGTMGTGDMRTWDGALKGLWGQGVGFWGTMGTRGWALRGPGGQGGCEGRQGTGWGSWGATRNVGPRGCSSQGTSGTRRQPPPPGLPMPTSAQEVVKQGHHVGVHDGLARLPVPSGRLHRGPQRPPPVPFAVPPRRTRLAAPAAVTQS